MSSVTHPNVSVIMPVYNAVDYVADAAQSILSRNQVPLELILVDDGSADGSAEACDMLARSDERVRVLHVPNGGMCHARNLALEVARGEYVTFADNDDECLPGFVDQNYAMAQEHDADIVRFGRRTETFLADSAKPEVTVFAPDEQAVLTGNRIYEQLNKVLYGSNGVWTNLYRRTLLQRHGVRFNEELRRGCEDKLFNLDALDHAQTVCLNPNVYYVWRRRASRSSSLSLDDNYFLGYGLYLHRLSQFLDEHNMRKVDSALCKREFMLPFREMVGARCRAGEASMSEDREFCAFVRAAYEGYWDLSLVDPKVPQSVVLMWVMTGHYTLAALALRSWRVLVQRRMR